MSSEFVMIGYVPRPGIVDVQYMARNIARKGGRGIIVFRDSPTYNVKIKALHGDVELVEAKRVKRKVKELGAHYKGRGFSIVIKDLGEVRDGMRDPM